MQTTPCNSPGLGPAGDSKTDKRLRELREQRAKIDIELLLLSVSEQFSECAAAAIGQIPGVDAIELTSTGVAQWMYALSTNTDDFKEPLWTARLSNGVVVAQIPRMVSPDGATLALSALTAFTDRGGCADTRALFVPKNVGRCALDCPVLSTFPISDNEVQALGAFYDLVPRDILVTITTRLEAFFASAAKGTDGYPVQRAADASSLAPVIAALRSMLRPVERGPFVLV